MSEDVSADATEQISIKEAIRAAKTQVAELFEGEAYSQLGLEEVKYDSRNGEWLITLGLNRPWNVEKQVQSGSVMYGYGIPASTTRQVRTYKKVRIDGKTGQFISMEGSDD
jgi:hypothetical protein